MQFLPLVPDFLSTINLEGDGKSVIEPLFYSCKTMATVDKILMI